MLISENTCAYWDWEIEEWNTIGCWVASITSTSTNCACIHTTEFAISGFFSLPAVNNKSKSISAGLYGGIVAAIVICCIFCIIGGASAIVICRKRREEQIAKDLEMKQPQSVNVTNVSSVSSEKKSKKPNNRVIVDIPSDLDEVGLRSFLGPIKMTKYFNVLFSNKIDFTVLADKNIEDLEALGIPHEDAKIIISEIMAQTATYLGHEIEIGDLIGSGVFGEVYEGIWKNSHVALKRLYDDELLGTYLVHATILTELR